MNIFLYSTRDVNPPVQVLTHSHMLTDLTDIIMVPFNKPL